MPTIVLNPAHGGTDSGAHGASGLSEKDLALNIARAIRNELARQGLRVVMVRDSDANPSFDDRAGTANALANAVFISLHISSTGSTGTARTYFYRFAAPFAFPGASADGGPIPAAQAASSGLIPWDEAQRNYVAASHRLAGILQASLGQRFAGSPTASASAPVRELRSVASPAVAIELSSISASNPAVVGGMAVPLASAIAQSVMQFQSSASEPSGAGAASGGTP